MHYISIMFRLLYLLPIEESFPRSRDALVPWSAVSLRGLSPWWVPRRGLGGARPVPRAPRALRLLRHDGHFLHNLVLTTTTNTVRLITSLLQLGLLLVLVVSLGGYLVAVEASAGAALHVAHVCARACLVARRRSVGRSDASALAALRGMSESRRRGAAHSRAMVFSIRPKRRIHADRRLRGAVVEGSHPKAGAPGDGVTAPPRRKVTASSLSR